ncbi:helix-turn-helix domain-containing protein [Kribbella soli]|uniref:XRE family transcriptional regulator n=1 Tax=Kribbella soli TaxID=1124743 RepID=A0A4R0H5D1_9ACTN|nr:helix-turn-helix domain-containing protein [Kribbella soli]TCC03652.1 XRE family transcriptional regulator [Kribbella soli]
MTDAHTRNVERQIEWYGEPLGDRFARLLARLGLSQAQLAGVLGLSAPMLSQLMSGHRSKISSPAVLSRLLHLEAMVGDAAWDALSQDERSRRLADVRAAERSTLTMVTSEVQPAEAAPARPQPAGDPVTVIQDVLRAVASAAELESAAHLLEQDYPDLAEALRVLGTGRTPDARAYYSRIVAGPA